MDDNISLIVGLGNPGKQYQNTRHNIGFITVDKIAEKLNIGFDREKFKGLIAEGRVNNRNVLLLKPMTFMNKSGESVAQAARNKINSPGDLFVIYDDVELPLGKIRIRKNGSAGTHNGMRSIVERVGTKEFPRLRIGVGMDKKAGDLADHVLGKFHPDERNTVTDLVEAAADAAIRAMEQGIESAMNEFNGYTTEQS
jgi:PTH1 family peptidyl-tRNA hydrolase